MKINTHENLKTHTSCEIRACMCAKIMGTFCLCLVGKYMNWSTMADSAIIWGGIRSLGFAFHICDAITLRASLGHIRCIWVLEQNRCKYSGSFIGHHIVLLIQQQLVNTYPVDKKFLITSSILPSPKHIHYIVNLLDNTKF